MTKSERRRASYNKLMMELYKENQSFLNKAIFGVSSLSIPLIFNALNTNNISIDVAVILGFSLSLLFLVITFQILSLRIAIDGCDKSMGEGKNAVGEGALLFDRARMLNTCRDIFFLVALALMVVALFVGVVERGIKMSGNYHGKRFQNSFTPPTSSTEQQRSSVPPKETVSQNRPVEKVPISTGTNPPIPPVSNNSQSSKK